MVVLYGTVGCFIVFHNLKPGAEFLNNFIQKLVLDVKIRPLILVCIFVLFSLFITKPQHCITECFWTVLFTVENVRKKLNLCSCLDFFFDARVELAFKNILADSRFVQLCTRYILRIFRLKSAYLTNRRPEEELTCCIYSSLKI